MIVTAWNNGQHHTGGTGYGLKLSVTDRDRYFKREWRTVLVELPDSKVVEANVDKKSFWGPNCRELISKEFGAWLRREGLAPWKSGQPPKLQLTPVGEGRFQLHT